MQKQNNDQKKTTTPTFPANKLESHHKFLRIFLITILSLTAIAQIFLSVLISRAVPSLSAGGRGFIIMHQNQTYTTITYVLLLLLFCIGISNIVGVFLLIKRKVRIKKVAIAFVIFFIWGIIASFGIASMQALQIKQALDKNNLFYTDNKTCEVNTGKKCIIEGSYWIPGKITASSESVPATSVDKNGPWLRYSDITRGFEVDHPSKWYVLNYVGYPCLTMSDIPNPQDIPSKMPAEKHEYIQVCSSKEQIPTTFAYANGSSENKTIAPYTINKYSGIRGLETSTAGLADVVYLSNPNGGYVQFTHLFGDKSIFDNILFSFSFLDQVSLTPPPPNIPEGKSCGPNAGNAQCDPGFTCVYKNQEDVQNNVGTCMKFTN